MTERSSVIPFSFPSAALWLRNHRSASEARTIGDVILETGAPHSSLSFQMKNSEATSSSAETESESGLAPQSTLSVSLQRITPASTFPFQRAAPVLTIAQVRPTLFTVECLPAEIVFSTITSNAHTSAYLLQNGDLVFCGIAFVLQLPVPVYTPPDYH